MEKINEFKFKQITKSRFIRNVTLIASGTALAQLITIVFSPIITRFYGPEAFGLLGIFTSLLGIISPVGALAYPIAIVLPRKDADAKGLVRLSLFIGAFTASILAVLLFLRGGEILALLDSEAIAPYSLLLPFAVFFSVCEQVLGQWVIRKKYFALKARIAVFQSAVLNLSKSGAGFFIPSGALLIFLSTAGQFFHAFLLWAGVKIYQKNTISDREETESYSMNKIAKEYYDFPVYRAPQVFLNGISQSLPVLMLASFFGPASAGFYSLGRRILGLPSGLIGQAVGDVFYPRITEASHKGENIYRLILKATLALAAVALIPFAFVFVFGPWLFSFVFGEEWVIAGEYSRWMALWIYFTFINTPSLMAIPLLEAQRFQLFFSVNTLLVRTSAMIAGCYYFKNDLVAVIIFSVSGAIANIILILNILLKSKNMKRVRSI